MIHRPAPWFIVADVPGSEIGYRAIVDAEGFTVCDPSPMGEANAALIAAAPDLLEALQWALDQIEDSLDPDHQAALNAAHNAITRATGGNDA